MKPEYIALVLLIGMIVLAFSTLLAGIDFFNKPKWFRRVEKMKIVKRLMATSLFMVMIVFAMSAFADHVVTADIGDGVYAMPEYTVYHRGTDDFSFHKVSNNDDSNNDTGANAGGGGKVKNPWQPGDSGGDICTVFLPEGLDLANCVDLASTSSGKTYLCGTLEDYTVYCPD